MNNSSLTRDNYWQGRDSSLSLTWNTTTESLTSHKPSTLQPAHIIIFDQIKGWVSRVFSYRIEYRWTPPFLTESVFIFQAPLLSHLSPNVAFERSAEHDLNIELP